MSRRLFVSEKEIAFIAHCSKELIQEVVGQKIIYYSVSDELTKSNDLYGESINKIVYTPVEINARVLYNAPEQIANQFTVETVYTIEIYFHQNELNERNVIAREGDFIQYGDKMWEVLSLTKPQFIFGQIDHEVETLAKCRMAREGQFSVGELEMKV